MPEPENGKVEISQEGKKKEATQPSEAQATDQVWTLRFDGSKSKSGNGASIELRVL